MLCSRYTLARHLGVFWRWEAHFRGESTASGTALSPAAARRAARNWLRARQAAAATQAGDPDPLAMAAE